MILTTHKTSNGTRTQGFTLVEALIAMAVSGMVVLALVSMMVFSGRVFAAIFNYVDLDDSNRVAMDVISRDIRTAQRVVSFTTNEFRLKDASGADLTYRYSPGAKTLTRVSAGRSKVLLEECQRFSFRICQRTPKDAVYEVFPAATAETAKVIDLSWLCSRNILGEQANTESVQTARIVIRGQTSM
jgi:type II secretory pathway pseudopilin PulG